MPAIGLQLGETMPDDFSCWSQKELQMMKETIAKVRQCGYEQKNERGNNFIRLLDEKGKEYIAD